MDLKIRESFRDLSGFERALLLTSMVVIICSYSFSGAGDVLTLISSLIGVTALIFIAKGYVLGQVLCLLFSVFYGIVSFFFCYYGEMITYLGMNLPMNVLAIISWLRHPYEGSKEVEIHRLDRRQIIIMIVLAVVVTIAFYFILSALGNANLNISVFSVTTSFVAAYLTFCRSHYYAVGYAVNDVVLIVLWVLAAMEDISYLPMVFCFVMILVNDIYGFYSWRNMLIRQSA